ncbi:MAG: VOC family protein [Paracoccaceae bacterium]
MQQRVSLITLGVADLGRAAGFYDAMGWQRVDTPDPGIIAYDLLSQCLGLYPIDKLAADIGVAPDALGRGAMTLAHNTATAAEVHSLTDRAVAAGGTVLRPAGEVFWGGTIAYVTDLDGHIWEFAHNPFSPLGADGAFQWNGVSP